MGILGPTQPYLAKQVFPDEITAICNLDQNDLGWGA